VPSLDRLAADVVARAQETEPRVYRIGLVAPLTSGDVELGGHGDDSQDSGNHLEFKRRLADLGFVEGGNLAVEYRYARQPERWTAFAAELAKLPVVVILAQGPAAAQTIQGAGPTPVVFAIAADPVPAFVSNLMRPGGTVTGTTSLSTQGSASRLPLLIEAFPGLRHVASLYYGFGPTAAQRQFSVVSARAQDLDVNVDLLAPQTAEELAGALEAIDHSHADGLLYFRGGPSPPDSDPTIDGVIAWAKPHRLPAVYIFRYFVERGGLMAVDTDPFENWRQAADRAAQILQSAYPGDLPVGEPTELRLFINLNAAQEQGLEFPQSIIDQTTEVLGQ
jgi:putative ABC transport system substrate-binding protein